MNTTHTQGPWRVVDLSQEAHELAVLDTDKNRIGLFAAIRLEDSTPTDEDFANAHLIAAAPELLEALRHALNSITHGQPDLEGEDDFTMQFDDEPEFRTDLKMIRAAIAKAEGAE